MLRHSRVLQRCCGVVAATVPRNYRRVTAFQPFSQNDEYDLMRVVKTKPYHVLKHVRQHVWRSRRRDLQFRHTVTQLMIVLQEYLRKQLIDPACASHIMEGILEECVKVSQHDMAHLLFRAFLRFRKYGCTVSVDALRFLYESYKTSDSSEMMRQLATEMQEDAALRPLCIAAYLFAGLESEAETLRAAVPLAQMTAQDMIALAEGYDKLKKNDCLVELAKGLRDAAFEPSDAALVYNALFRIYYKRSDHNSFADTLKMANDAKVPLGPVAFSLILRERMRRATCAEDIAAAEEELKELGYTPDITGTSIIITAHTRLLQFGDRASEELMLSKVDTLLSSIESRLMQNDPDVDITAAHIRAVIRGYGAAGRPEAIRDAWQRMQCKGVTNDVRVYNEVFKWFALMGNVKGVIALKEEMDSAGVHADALTYTWILRGLRKFFPRHVQRLYEEIQERHVRPDTHLYTTLLGIFGDLGRHEEVGQILSEMRRREESGTLQCTPITYAVLIRIHGDNTERAEEFYAEAKKRNMADHPHVQTSMLHVLASIRGDDRVAKVGSFLSQLPFWGTDVYNVLLHMYARQNDREKVDQTLSKMMAEDVPMNDVTVGTLITAFGRWGDVERVSGILQLMKEHKSEVSAAFYSVLASCLNRIGDEGGVSEAWDDLLSSKLFPDTEVYNQFLAIYSRQHNVTKMQGVLDNMMRQVPPNPVTATTVVDMLGKCGRVGEMEALFEDMKTTPDTHPTAVTYHQVMNTYAKTGEITKMERVHEEYIKAGHTENAVTYNILMDGYGRSKLLHQMEDMLQKRKSNGVPPDDITYCIMISAYGKARMEKELTRLYAELLTTERNGVTSLRVLWTFIDAFCRCGDCTRLEQCVDRLKMVREGGALKVSDVRGLIPYFCRLGQMSKVEELTKKLEGTGAEIGYPTLNSIARGYARAGRFDKTVQTLHLLRDRNWVPDASTALTISGSFIKAGLHEQAHQIIEWRRQYATHTGEQSVPEETSTT